MNAIILNNLSNSENALNDLKGKLTSLGAAEAKGSSSRPVAGLRLTDAAMQGLLREDDAAEMFAAYVKGIISTGAKNPLVTGAGNADSHKAQVSKFRTFIKVGMLPAIDAVEVMTRASGLIGQATASGVKTYSPFDALLSVAREQMKQPNDALTDDQITAIITKPEPKEKDEIEKLVDAYKRAVTLAEKIPMPATLAARDAYADAIIEAGGELPPTTKAEKDLAAFKAKAAKLGYSLQ